MRNFSGGAGGKFGFKVYGAEKINSKLNKYLSFQQSKLYGAVVKSAIIVQAEAINLVATGYYKPAIDTGRMRNSISFEIVYADSDFIEAKVGTSVYYAIYVHEGTKKSQSQISIDSAMDNYTGDVKMKKRPFLTDALKNKKEIIIANITKAMKIEYGIV